MARAIWSGAISFGLLNVPVKLYSAVSSRSISFRQLRESDGSRVKNKRVAESDGKEVPWEKIVKGYELSPDRYVVLTRDELGTLEPEKTKAIEIEDFVEGEQIDPMHYDHPYYLAPQAGAEKPYSLLVKAMADSGKVAIARFVFHNKEHLAAIRPMGKVLTMTTMRFADEIVPAKQIEAETFPEKRATPRPQELKMARQLIDSLVGEFDPESYRDQYRERLIELIEAKASGETVEAPEGEERKPTKAPDLMAALEASLAEVKTFKEDFGKKDGKGTAAKKRPAKRAAAKRGSSKAKSNGSRARKSAPKKRAKAKTGR